MDFLDNARTWYDAQTKELKNVFVSLYPVPGGKGQALMYQDGEPNEVWHQVEHMIRSTANRYSRFNIRLARGAKNDPTPVNFPVDIPWNANHAPVSAGQYGINGLEQPAINGGGQTIGEIRREMERSFEEKLNAFKERKELEDRLAGLEYELKEKRKRSADVWERIEGFAETTGLDLSNPQSIQAIGGIVMGALDKIIGALTGNVSSTAPALGSAPAGKTRIVEQSSPASVSTGTEDETDGDDTDEGSIDFNRPIRMELAYQGIDDPAVMALDFNPGVEAMVLLRQAGAENPGDMLLKVAEFYKANPEQAENIFKNFLK